MDFIDVDLTEVFAIEHRVSRKQVDRFKGMGVERLLDLLQHPWYSLIQPLYDGGDIIVDGCHKSRALLELGQRDAVVCYQHSVVSPSQDLRLLREIIVLGDSYESWYRGQSLREPKGLVDICSEGNLRYVA